MLLLGMCDCDLCWPLHVKIQYLSKNFHTIKTQYFVYVACIYYLPIAFIIHPYTHIFSPNMHILTFCHFVGFPKNLFGAVYS